MLGLFNFFKLTKLFSFILCLVALYYAINLVIIYYFPTALPFLNMYFIHYLFFSITLFFSVAINNNVEMSDITSMINTQQAVPIPEENEAPIRLSKPSSSTTSDNSSNTYKVGDKVAVKDEDGQGLEGTITQIESDNNYSVKYVNGNTQTNVNASNIIPISNNVTILPNWNKPTQKEQKIQSQEQFIR